MKAFAPSVTVSEKNSMTGRRWAPVCSYTPEAASEMFPSPALPLKASAKDNSTKWGTVATALLLLRYILVALECAPVLVTSPVFLWSNVAIHQNGFSIQLISHQQTSRRNRNFQTTTILSRPSTSSSHSFLSFRMKFMFTYVRTDGRNEAKK